MPRQKTHSGAKKKFRVTGGGKLLRRSANQGHLLEHKSPKQKRAFSKALPVARANARTVRKMLGRG